MAPRSAFSTASSRSRPQWEQVRDILDVWFDQRLDARLHAGGPAALPDARRRQARARRRQGPRHVPRRLRPAPRLVPVIAAGILRHPRPRALRHRADARLRPRREGAEDVEVRRQRRLAAGRDEDVRRRHPAPVGGGLRLFRRPAHRPRHPQELRRDLPQAAQHAALDARRAGASRQRTSASSSRTCASSSSSG